VYFEGYNYNISAFSWTTSLQGCGPLLVPEEEQTEAKSRFSQTSQISRETKNGTGHEPASISRPEEHQSLGLDTANPRLIASNCGVWRAAAHIKNAPPIQKNPQQTANQAENEN
jgi:hypothetical protein